MVIATLTASRSTLRRSTLCLLILPLLLLLASCTPQVESETSNRDSAPGADAAQGLIGSCSLDLAAGATDEEAIQAVLAAEGELVVAQEIEPLMGLWMSGSTVADAKNTPEDENDDQTWSDRDAIRHRYVRTVFPGAPDSIEPADLIVEIDGDRAVVRATTHIGDEVSPAGDRWVLTKIDGCWVIESLTYNLESSE